MSGAGLVLVGAFMVSLIAQSLLVRTLGQRVVDVPNHRSSHAIPTPRVGGVGVLLGVLTTIPAIGFSVPVLAGWLLGLVGLRDDIKPISASLRLLCQIFVLSLVLLALGLAVPWGSLLLVLAVGYVNAFNFMDGANGISGFNAVLSGVNFAVAGYVYDTQATLFIGVALAGSVVGFLPINLSGRMFLGDVGSYAIGSLIAAASLMAWASGVPWPIVVGPLLIYLADTGSTIVRRVFRGENILSPHRDHVYQQLLVAGAGHPVTALVTATFGALTAVGGWTIVKWPLVGAAVWLLAVGFYLWGAVPISRRLAPRDGA